MTQPPRRFFSRRRVLGVSATGIAGLAAVGITSKVMAEDDENSQSSVKTEVSLTWLGNNSWEITSGNITILIDPWLTRFHTGTYSEAGADPNTPIVSDPDKIDPYIDKCNHILVTHGHYDHMPDVPYIAKKTGATVMGTESHLNMLRALGAPDSQLSTVSGGEIYSFEGYTIEVFRSAHSAGGERGQLPFPGTRPATVPDPAPTKISDLVEGGSLAYQITIGDVKILDFGSSNYIGREIEGLRPTVLLMQPGGANVPGYVSRAMQALGNPRYVIPTHWDDFDKPLDKPAKDWGGLDALRDAVEASSPSSKFVVVDHLETFTPS